MLLGIATLMVRSFATLPISIWWIGSGVSVASQRPRSPLVVTYGVTSISDSRLPSPAVAVTWPLPIAEPFGHALSDFSWLALSGSQRSFLGQLGPRSGAPSGA